MTTENDSLLTLGAAFVPSLIDQTAAIVSAFVANNAVPVADLPALIASTHAALIGIGQPAAAEPEKPTPPVPIKKTITPDHIISLEDGKPYKSLKRHLTTRGLTPEEYKRKWGLPSDYPMVSESYSKQRSALAVSAGLGQRRRGRVAA